MHDQLSVNLIHLWDWRRHGVWRQRGLPCAGLFIQSQQLSQRRLDADLAIERGIAPLVESLHAHQRRVVATRLNLGFLGNDLETPRRTATHHSDFFRVTSRSVRANRRGTNFVRSGPQVDADKCKTRHLIFMIEPADADVLV